MSSPCRLQYVEVDAQQLQMKQRHEPKAVQEAIEAEYMAAAKAKSGKRSLGFDQRTRAAAPLPNAVPSADDRKPKKRWVSGKGFQPGCCEA